MLLSAGWMARNRFSLSLEVDANVNRGVLRTTAYCDTIYLYCDAWFAIVLFVWLLLAAPGFFELPSLISYCYFICCSFPSTLFFQSLLYS